MSMTLVKGGKPRRLSGPEIQALVADRVAARQAKWAEEREAREADRNYSERMEFYGLRPKRNVWVTLTCIGALGVAGGLAWIFSTETAAALGLILSLGLMAVATFLSTRGDQ